MTKARLALVGLGGLFFGVTGPLLSTFVPILVRNPLGEQRTAIGAVMAIDNVLLLLLVPWAGVVSDRASSAAAAGCRSCSSASAWHRPAWPCSRLRGSASGTIGAMVLLYPDQHPAPAFQALIADLVPSRQFVLATASVTFQMCVGAIVFDARADAGDAERFSSPPARCRDCRRLRAGLRAGTIRHGRDRSDVPIADGCDAVRGTGRGAGVRAVFVATLLLQMIFSRSRPGLPSMAPSGSACGPKTSRSASSPGRWAA